MRHPPPHLYGGSKPALNIFFICISPNIVFTRKPSQLSDSELNETWLIWKSLFKNPHNQIISCRSSFMDFLRIFEHLYLLYVCTLRWSAGKKTYLGFWPNSVELLGHYRRLPRKNLSSLGGGRGKLEIPKGHLLLKLQRKNWVISIYLLQTFSRFQTFFSPKFKKSKRFEAPSRKFIFPGFLKCFRTAGYEL